MTTNGNSNKTVKWRGVSRRAVLAGAGAALAMPLISRTTYAAGAIPVGVIVGLTGRASPWGVPVANAVRLAVEQINNAGGIKSKGGAKIELIVADHQSQAQLAGTLTERMTQLQKVVCIFGNATSGASLVGSKAAENARTAMISPDLGDSLTEQGLKYFFRIGARSTVLSQAAVNFALQTEKQHGAGPKRVAILADDSTFSQDCATALAKELAKSPWKVAENISYPGGGVSDFVPIIQRLKMTGVDLLFQATFAPDGIQIVRAMKAMDYAPLAAIHVAGAPYTPDFQASLKQDAEYILDAVGFVPELIEKNERMAKYNEAYRQRYNSQLDEMSSIAVTSVGVLYDALERTDQLTPEAVAQAIRTTDLQVGANPYIIRDGVKFDPKGDNERVKPLMMQIQDGQQRVVWPDNLATKKLVWPTPKWSQRKS